MSRISPSRMSQTSSHPSRHETMDSNRSRLADDFMGRSIEQPRPDMYRGGGGASRMDDNFAENTGSSNRSRLADDFMGHHHGAGGRDQQQQRGNMYRGGGAPSRIDEAVGYNRNPDCRCVDNELKLLIADFGSTAYITKDR